MAGAGAGWIAAAILCVTLACSGREPAPEAGEDVVIGVIAPLASDFFRSGMPTVEGAQLAVDEINAAGGVAVGSQHRRLRLVVEDNDDRPETAVSKAFKLIGTDRAAVLIGLTVSNSAVAVAKVAEEQRVPMITTTSTSPETTRDKRFVFRAIFDDSFQGRLMAELAAGDLGARKAAMISDPASTYSRGFADVFRQVFEQQGGEVVAEESYALDDEDVSARLERLGRASADVMVVPIYPVLLTSLVPQIRAAGITVPLLGGDSWGAFEDHERRGWGPAYFSDVWTPEVPSEESRRFVEAYSEAHSRPLTSYAALAYDAVGLVAAAIEAAGDASPASIRDGLLVLDDFIGATGTIRFPDSGDPVRSAVIMRLDEQGSAHLHRRHEP